MVAIDDVTIERVGCSGRVELEKTGRHVGREDRATRRAEVGSQKSPSIDMEEIIETLRASYCVTTTFVDQIVRLCVLTDRAKDGEIFRDTVALSRRLGAGVQFPAKCWRQSDEKKFSLVAGIDEGMRGRYERS